MNKTEKIGLDKIVFYPPEVYALHYKGEPFSISKVSLQEQYEMGVRYASRGTTVRKCYFTKGHAKTGLKLVPKQMRESIEIVKYVPEKKLKDKILNMINNQCTLEDIKNFLNNFNIK